MASFKLEFDTAMIDFTTNKEILSPSKSELKELGITTPVRTSDAVEDQKNLDKFTDTLDDNRDNVSKFTLGDALNQLFDSIEMPGNSDFALYADTLKNIRIAKKDNESRISSKILIFLLISSNAFAA